MTKNLAANQRQERVDPKQQTTANQAVVLRYQILVPAAECTDEIAVSSAPERRECLIDKAFDIQFLPLQYRRSVE